MNQRLRRNPAARSVWSPRSWARLAAIVMTIESVLAVRGQLRIPGHFTVTNDAAATAANILGDETLYQFGVTLSLLAVAFHSGFLPRLVGLLEMLAGVAYLVLLWPPLARAWHPYYLFFAAGELVLGIWLLFKGVDSERWYERAGVFG